MAKKTIISLFISLLSSGCSPIESAETVATDIKDNIYTTTSKVKEWALTSPKDSASREIANSYCYRTLQDILCYHQPMPGWENRLVAYQGTHAEPPSPYTMQLLPKRETTDSSLPTNRVAASKPVFEKPPVPTKEEKNTEQSTQSNSVDSSHEALPDPSQVPQL